MSINRQWFVKPLPQRWGVPIWLLAAFLWLATCIEPGLDIDILNIDEEADTMTISVGPDVIDEALYGWVSRECRDIMVLPPIEPVPIKVWQRADRQADRTTFLFGCTRP